uniref:ATP synthase subunit a n=1 Tax=Mengenilla moldrzyki TaxID=1155016 RepID=J3RK26_MENMO|nr:ATP synthase F0 subunit 6 [Mengenilla moldrzyki]AFC35463.1 ATP synthase F0 subunit 6 [Mengenilla moldrzyki]
MMMNIFSSFDPSTNIFYLNWLSIILLFFYLSNYWFLSNNITISWKIIFNYLHKEFFLITKNNNIMLIIMSIFFLIFMNNFWSLFPYIFSSSSHMIFSLSIALPFWLSLMIYGWINLYNNMFLHLSPSGTPFILMPMMIIIETLSNLIRPLTLMIRLSANMISGHILLSFISNINTMSNWIIMISLINIQFIYLILEFSVSLIQAYVFSILSTLYFHEIN